MKYILTILLIILLTNTYGQNEIVLHDTLGADSIIQVYYSNGQLFFQIPYTNGLQNGWYEQYHENGVVWAKDFRINGKVVNGYYRSLNEKGKIAQEGYYKNGHQVGKWYSYTLEGENSKIYIYNNKGQWIKLKEWNTKKQKWEKSRPY